MTERRLREPDLVWTRVSPRLVWTELATVLVVGLAIAAGCTLIGVAVGPTGRLWYGIAALVIVVVGLVAAFTPRRVRAIGYALRDDDLVFRRGLLFQRLIAVPYGRMQLIDVSRGPLGRVLDLSDLRLITAASVAIRIPGLAAEEAERLRDRLVDVAESRRAGL